MMIGVPGSADGRCHTFKGTLSSVSIRKVSCSNSIISGVLQYVLVGLIPYDKTVDVSRMSIKVVLFMMILVDVQIRMYLLRRWSWCIIVDDITGMINDHIAWNQIDVVFIHESCGLRIQNTIYLATFQLKLFQR